MQLYALSCHPNPFIPVILIKKILRNKEILCDEVNKVESPLTNPNLEPVERTPEELEEINVELEDRMGVLKNTDTKHQHFVFVCDYYLDNRNYTAIRKFFILQRDICVLIKKTPSVDELSKAMGITHEQVKLFIAIAHAANPEDRSVENVFNVTVRFFTVVFFHNHIGAHLEFSTETWLRCN